ncbi:nudix domain-containing [Trichoderma cornu-damae]|uniref:Structure-specific endonuclease subunit SLX4 n=1 Tax=Trichoderma cornu-damae TaxID=654480 RepID=A0A9P8QM85_9HYPO|nr:nudix domain-containing [Trichoderma cornu-damae]
MDGSENGTAEARATATEDTGPTPAQWIEDCPVPVGEAKPTRGENDIDEPLRLELAMARRLDWTPPSTKTTVIPKLDSAALGYPRSSGEGHEAAKSFEQIVEAYKCADSLQQEVSMPLGEADGILGKRKLIELVMTTTAPAETSAEPKEDRPPAKRNAPKKRPRTITELATSAYRAADPLESEPIALDTSNASTNKEPEALQEVSRQDFVFGTSSQLAIENSPTFLRDLEAAMRRSNQVDYIDFDTPLNSDDVEPLERKRLWAAGARDVDGDLLFDLEMSRITERSSQLLPAQSNGDDPFGYIAGGEKPILSTASAVGANVRSQSDLFVNTADAVSPGGVEPMEIITIDDSIMIGGDDNSTGSPAQRRTKPTGGSQSMEETRGLCGVGNSDQAQHLGSKPSFELFTDAQLSKEIASYGFKAVKSRQAKIALLEQCWQGKSHLAQPGSKRMVATLAATGGSASSSNVKTPRRQPRKNSTSATEAQEPPPSAQPPPASPSKLRGRPKKAATTAKRSPAGSAVGKKKASSRTAAAASAAQKRKPKPAKVVVEIPDSASDSDGSLSSDPASSPESTFSPPPVDLSLSAMDDIDALPSLTSAQDGSLIFEYIARAVKSAPRTADPTDPSWHEKILLYDPIVLEDFTAWLNCGQLTRVGFDGEVSTMEVKQWCESKSICCLWKVNLRGKERKRCR